MSRPKKDNISRKPFTTQLPERIINSLKHLAIDKKKANYEIIEEALSRYIDQEKEGGVDNKNNVWTPNG
jgi:hypothetical protein